MRRLAVLQAASAAGLVAVVSELAGQVNLQGEYYPLYIAASNGHLEVVRALLEAKADVDLADNDGVTPLFMAACNGHLEVGGEKRPCGERGARGSTTKAMGSDSHSGICHGKTKCKYA